MFGEWCYHKKIDIVLIQEPYLRECIWKNYNRCVENGKVEIRLKKCIRGEELKQWRSKNSKNKRWEELEGNIRKLCDSVVVSRDFNAKNQEWGGEDINTRGESLMNWILLNGFNLENKSGQPTFSCFRGESCIDVTLMKNVEISNWMVNNKESFCDHRIIITFEIIENVKKRT